MVKEEKEGQKELCGQVPGQGKLNKEQKKVPNNRAHPVHGKLSKGENLEEYDPNKGKSENGKIPSRFAKEIRVIKEERKNETTEKYETPKMQKKREEA